MSLAVQARRYDTSEPVSIEIAEGRIQRIVPAWPSGAVDDWPLIAPALLKKLT